MTKNNPRNSGLFSLILIMLATGNQSCDKALEPPPFESVEDMCSEIAIQTGDDCSNGDLCVQVKCSYYMQCDETSTLTVFASEAALSDIAKKCDDHWCGEWYEVDCYEDDEIDTGVIGVICKANCY